MPFVTFAKSFTLKEDETTTTTWPDGWRGNVSDDIAELAAAEGCFGDTEPVGDDLADDAAALADMTAAPVGDQQAEPVGDDAPPAAPAAPAKAKK